MVDDFELNVKNRIKRSDSDLIIRCGFSLENNHLSPFENGEPIVSSQYWSTEPYPTRSFNEYIYSNLKESVFKSVINSGMTRSS